MASYNQQLQLNLVSTCITSKVELHNVRKMDHQHLLRDYRTKYKTKQYKLIHRSTNLSFNRACDGVLVDIFNAYGIK